MVLVTSRMEYQYGCVKWSLTLKQNTDGGNVIKKGRNHDKKGHFFT